MLLFKLRGTYHYKFLPNCFKRWLENNLMHHQILSVLPLQYLLNLCTSSHPSSTVLVQVTSTAHWEVCSHPPAGVSVLSLGPTCQHTRWSVEGQIWSRFLPYSLHTPPSAAPSFFLLIRMCAWNLSFFISNAAYA